MIVSLTPFIARDPATGQGLTDLWLADRAAMLAWQNEIHQADAEATALHPYTSASTSGIAPQHFKDNASGKEIHQGGLINLDQRQFIFGGNDTLYGGADNDFADGGAANDASYAIPLERRAACI